MGLFRDDAEIKVISPLSPAECMLRFRERTDPFWKIWGLPVTGNFKGEADVFLGRQLVSSSLFSTILKIKTVENNGGAMVLCRPRAGVVTRIAAYAWLSGLLMIGGPLFVAGLYDLIFSDAPFYSRNWSAPLVVLGILAGAAAIYVMGRSSYERDKDYLIDFVRRTVGGYGIDL